MKLRLLPVSVVILLRPFCATVGRYLLLGQSIHNLPGLTQICSLDVGRNLPHVLHLRGIRHHSGVRFHWKLGPVARSFTH
ncbi:hypothetical protein K439DRAFT_1627771 [Ramaria rubella]|nr:hypothetical protein K439DRAFT_1627771 [Ramaria rubella]